MKEEVATPVVRLKGVSKRFGAVQALSRADFESRPGEIHVVLGENGAGKTSLMSVLAGLYRADEGVIEVDGRRVAIHNPAHALALGIAMIPQHVELIPSLRVWENVVLGQEKGRWWLDRRRHREEVLKLAEAHGLDVDPDVEAGRLSAGEQQKVEILKMLYRRARILILDEPTTYLAPQETDALFETLITLARRDITVLLVTHKIRDALRIGHRLTVMRAGQVVATVSAGEADEGRLVQWLMGTTDGHAEPLSDGRPSRRGDFGEALLRTVELSTTGSPGRVALRDITLRVRQGEIVGIAGVAGSGQRELAEVLAGLWPAQQGQVLLCGMDITRWPVGARIGAGLAMVPEDRIQDGILPSMALSETLVLGLHRRLFAGLRYRTDLAVQLAERAVREFEIKAPDVHVPTAHLSGGNVQKVLVARAMEHCCRHRRPVLVALNPTRGLDVRGSRLVHDRLHQVARQGGGVLLMSEDLDELMATCHRLEVLRDGRLVGAFDGPGYDRYRIGQFMLGR